MSTSIGYTTLRIALALSSGSKAVTVLQREVRIVVESNVDRTLFNYILISKDLTESSSYYGISEDELRGYLQIDKLTMDSSAWLPV